MNRNQLQVAAFPTELGWMALACDESTVKHLVFGHPSRAAALAAIASRVPGETREAEGWDWLIERLQDFATGARVDFKDVKLDLAHLSEFQRRVLRNCRSIAYGQTRSYGRVAAAAGSARAARAVGNTMAANRFPILVPCHRVINSDGSIGNYSAPTGVSLKQRMLELEGRAAPARLPVRSVARSAAGSARLSRRPTTARR